MKARLPKGYGGGGPSNLQQLARQAQKLQEANGKSDRRSWKQRNTRATAGGEAVKATVTGKLELKSVATEARGRGPAGCGNAFRSHRTAAVNEALRAAQSDKSEPHGENLRRPQYAGDAVTMADYRIAPLSRLIEQFQRHSGHRLQKCGAACISRPESF
jgi:DNA-binding protein YbaB